MLVARRAFGEGHRLTLKMRSLYADALHMDPAATLDDLREAVTTLEDVVQTTRRVFGGQHPFTWAFGEELQFARAALRLRETSRSA